ncbi:MAG: hypothetical protein Q9159_001444 [Coniocarpon cinnabarinum]
MEKSLTVKLRLRVPTRQVYISRIRKRDERGTIVEDRLLTSDRRAASGTQHDMGPRTRRGISAEPQKRSIRLTVKAPPRRLQEIKGDDDEVETRASRGRSGRSKNQRQSYVDKGSSAEEEEDDDEEDEEEEQDAAGDPDEQDEEDEDEEDEESDEEDEDADGDEDMEDAPPAPPPPAKSSKPTIKFSTSTSNKAGKARKPSPGTTINLGSNKHRTVEEKETGNAASESESSEVEDDPEDLENGALDYPDRSDTIKVDAINESDLDSEDSDSSLPDLSKLTRRQRGGIDEGSLLALSNEAQKKKFFTAEQITMRRAEMARRRKDLSERRNEQEKADTLRRLLQKPAPTRRSRAQVLADAEREEFGPGRAGLRGESVGGDEDEGEMEPKANRIYARTIIGRKGTRLGVPSEWLDAPIGAMFEKTSKGEGWNEVVRSGRMVEEVQ